MRTFIKSVDIVWDVDNQATQGVFPLPSVIMQLLNDAMGLDGWKFGRIFLCPEPTLLLLLWVTSSKFLTARQVFAAAFWY